MKVVDGTSIVTVHCLILIISKQQIPFPTPRLREPRERDSCLVDAIVEPLSADIDKGEKGGKGARGGAEENGWHDMVLSSKKSA